MACGVDFHNRGCVSTPSLPLLPLSHANHDLFT
jgi:hypothetical protein